jgi:hypothetical protein
VAMCEENIIPHGTVVEPGVIFGRHIILAGGGVVIRAGAKLDTACVIADGVVIGQGAWVRTGSVVTRSVPPNAIVEGNPAQVVGYTNPRVPGANPSVCTVNIDSTVEVNRPGSVPLEVGACSLLLMRYVNDARGSLTVGEVPSELPFSPARYFAVYGVPSLQLRGEHAHRLCKQFLICLHGSCRVLIDDGERRAEIILDRPDIGLYMPEMIWGTQYRYTEDAVLFVFASRPYEAEDYIRTYDEFLSEIQRRPSL